MNYHEYLQDLGYVNYPVIFTYTYGIKKEKEEVRSDAENATIEEDAPIEIEEKSELVEEEKILATAESRLSSTITDAEKKEAINLIARSVGDELEDELFYTFLISHASNAEQREIIMNIRDDERKHNRLLRELYFDITGTRLPQDALNDSTSFNISYMQGLEQALMGELAAVSKYQRILRGLDNMDHHNTVLEILTDELRHANKYNYLITKNLL